MKRTLLIGILLFSTASLVSAQTLEQWIRTRTDLVSEAKATQAAEQSQTASKQTDTPAGSEGGSLLDESSAADLFSAAFSLAATSPVSNSSTGLKSGTATAYAIAAAIHGVEPLDPVFYQRNAALRRYAFTVGTEKGVSGADDTKVYQLKVKLYDGRDPLAPQNFEQIQKILPDNIDVNLVATLAVDRIQNYLLSLPPERLKTLFKFTDEEVAAAAKLSVRATRPAVAGDVKAAVQVTIFNKLADASWASQLSKDELTRIDEILLPSAAAFAALDATAKKFIAGVRAKPQFAVAFTLKQPSTGHETYVGELIYDQGMSSTMMSLTANAAAELTHNSLNVVDHTYRAALRGRWEIAAGAVAKRGSYFDLTGEAKSHTGDKSTFKTQGKLTIPITGGFDLPISVTWANRTDLIKESKVTGHIGFTFDYSKLLELINTK